MGFGAIPPYRPLVLVGGPRSGTPRLRDGLTQLPGVATWPCDAINGLWRHGNRRYPSEELPPERATPRVRRYIWRQFDWVARRYNAHTVVEKTGANSLRVPFVDTVVPEARYLFIRCDGLDAVGSALKRWQAPLDIPYLAHKMRFVPATGLPWYAARYLGSRLHRLVSREGRVGLWGPQLDDMDRLLAEHLLDEVCALQWRQCVGASRGAFAAMPEAKWLAVAYEAFVQDPEAELGRVLDFVGVEAEADRRRAAAAGVRADSLGKGRAVLGKATAARLAPLVKGDWDDGGGSPPCPPSEIASSATPPRDDRLCSR